MNLSNLKPAWRQVKLQNSLEVIGHDEILQIIEANENLMVNRIRRFFGASILFFILMICCQGDGHLNAFFVHILGH